MIIEVDTIVKRAEELWQQTPTRFSKTDSRAFNKFLTGQCASIGKRFRAMPISGRWPIGNDYGSLLLVRRAHQEDGDIWTDRNPIAKYVNTLTLTLTPKDGPLTLKIEQTENLDGKTRLSFINVTREERTVTFTPVWSLEADSRKITVNLPQQLLLLCIVGF